MAKHPTTPADLAADSSMALAYGFHDVHRQLVDSVDAIAAEHGLEVAHTTIIHSLGLRGEMRMGDLAESVVVGAATITRRAKQLEERGLVTRQRSPESQREVLISLTKEGRRLFEQSFTRVHAAHQAYFDKRLTMAQQRDLKSLLDRL